MARAIWKGAISFGLVTIPVGLFSAVERKERIAFRQRPARDASPLDYKRVCEAENVEVPWSEIVKGYEYEKVRSLMKALEASLERGGRRAAARRPTRAAHRRAA